MAQEQLSITVDSEIIETARRIIEKSDGQYASMSHYIQRALRKYNEKKGD